MIFFAEAYLSELIRMNVVDRDGKLVGRLKDIAVRLGETFPLAAKLAVRRRGARDPFIVPWSAASAGDLRARLTSTSSSPPSSSSAPASSFCRKRRCSESSSPPRS